jgi:hypothetical protein
LHSSSVSSSVGSLAALVAEYIKEFVTPAVFTHVYAGVDKAPPEPVAQVGPRGSQGLPKHPNIQKTKICYALFGLDFVLLTKGSILDSCYEIWA